MEQLSAMFCWARGGCRVQCQMPTGLRLVDVHRSNVRFDLKHAMSEAPVNPLIIARGKELFLLIWECLSSRLDWPVVNRFIEDPSDADRILIFYAAFYVVNTKCVTCHAAYKRVDRLRSQVVEGEDNLCLCACCTAPCGYSDCVYCWLVEGALQLLAAIASGSGYA